MIQDLQSLYIFFGETLIIHVLSILIGSQCVKKDVAEVKNVMGFFNCSTSIQRHFPRWKINEQVYLVSHLPQEITHNGWHNISINTSCEIVKVTCFFKLSFNKVILNISSNTTAGATSSCHGEL